MIASSPVAKSGDDRRVVEPARLSKLLSCIVAGIGEGSMPVVACRQMLMAH
jgi:hypothetical protein